MLMAGLLLGSLLVFGGVGEHELLNWDDRSYVSNNPWVTNPNLSNTLDMFTQVRMSNWHPLTWLSFVPEYALCGDAAICYKLTNATLHAINSYLVVILAALVLHIISVNGWWRESDDLIYGYSQRHWAALFSGLLYLVHPQHVESITWIAERKDLLCGMFYFLAVITYCRPRSDSYWQNYRLPMLFFVLAAMSKSMAVSLPAILVVLDVFLLHANRLWNHRDIQFAIRVLLVEKLPFIVITLGLILLTLQSQSADKLETLSLTETLTLCLSGLQHYVLSFILPWGFVPFYPQEIVYESVLSFVPLLLVVGIGVVLLGKFGTFSRLMLAALFVAFFIVTIAPVIGIVKVGEQAYADRYSYIPMVGFYLVAGYLVVAALKISWQLTAAITVLAIGVLAGQSFAYKHTWQNDLVFWSAVVESYPDVAATPLDNLANSYASTASYQQAIELYERSIAIRPEGVSPYINMASIHEFLGEQEQALAVLARGAESNPDNAAIQSRAGRAHLLAGDQQAAESYLQMAHQLQPGLPTVLLNRGMLLLVIGELEAAIESLAAVPSTMPQHFEAGLLLVQAWAQLDTVTALQELAELRMLYGDDPQLMDLLRTLE